MKGLTSKVFFKGWRLILPCICLSTCACGLYVERVKQSKGGASTVQEWTVLIEVSGSIGIETHDITKYVPLPTAPLTYEICTFVSGCRLDWNLLSTASPAINAWMNPSNRFAIRVVHMLRCHYRRSTAIVTCLMSEALDIQGIHMPHKVGCSTTYNNIVKNY